MKILYDHQAFSMQKYGGISRYFYEIIKYNKKKDVDTVDVTTPLLFSDNYYISDRKVVDYRGFFSQRKLKGRYKLNLIFNKFESIKLLKRQDFDIFHPTYYDPYFLKYIRNKPFILTVYDMIHERFSGMFSVNDKTSEYKKLLCNKATKIIAISQSTKKDLIEIFNIKESKIEVVYLGNSLTLDNNSVKKDIDLPKKYILFVGSRGVYKNFNRFIEGVSSILHSDKDLCVVCAGGGKFDSSENQLFAALKISAKVFQHTLNDNELSLFYKNALIFVFPSLYEGFGIPVLESFACDCPLVCSNTSSLPEIAGNGAEYFDPYDSKSISTTIKNVLNDNKRKQTLRQNGRDRLKIFSWERTVEKTRDIYMGASE